MAAEKNIAEIQAEIASMKRTVAAKNTPDNVKKALGKAIANAEKQLEEASKQERKSAVSIRAEIASMKRTVDAKNTPDNVKKALSKAITNAEKELGAIEKEENKIPAPAKKSKVPAPSATVIDENVRKRLSALKSPAKKASGKTKSKKPASKKSLLGTKELIAKYAGAPIGNIIRDADRPALPSGKRRSKESGKTYYEYRANRTDINRQRYPMLEEGGEITDRELLIDGNRGIYIPQDFYEKLDFERFGLKKEDYADLSSPANEGYWDAWDDLLDEAKTKDGDYLLEDGDLWLVKADEEQAPEEEDNDDTEDEGGPEAAEEDEETDEDVTDEQLFDYLTTGDTMADDEHEGRVFIPRHKVAATDIWNEEDARLALSMPDKRALILKGYLEDKAAATGGGSDEQPDDDDEPLSDTKTVNVDFAFRWDNQEHPEYTVDWGKEQVNDLAEKHHVTATFDTYDEQGELTLEYHLSGTEQDLYDMINEQRPGYFSNPSDFREFFEVALSANEDSVDDNLPANIPVEEALAAAASEIQESNRSVAPSYFGGGKNITVYDYQTINFDNCRIAGEQFNSAMTEIGNDTDNPHIGILKNNLRLFAETVDNILGVEKEVVDFGEAFAAQITKMSIWLQQVGRCNLLSGLHIDTSFLDKHVLEIVSRLRGKEDGQTAPAVSADIDADERLLQEIYHELYTFLKENGVTLRTDFSLSINGGLNYFDEPERIWSKDGEGNIEKYVLTYYKEDDGGKNKYGSIIVYPKEKEIQIDLDDDIDIHSSLKYSSSSSDSEEDIKYMSGGELQYLKNKITTKDFGFHAPNLNESYAKRMVGVIKFIDDLVKNGIPLSCIYTTHRDADTKPTWVYLMIPPYIQIYKSFSEKNVKKAVDFWNKHNGYAKGGHLEYKDGRPVTDFDVVKSGGGYNIIDTRNNYPLPDSTVKYWTDKDNSFKTKDAAEQALGDMLKGMHKEQPAYADGGETESILPDEYYKKFHLKGNGKREYSVLQSGHSDSDLRQAVKQLFPSMTMEEHKKLAEKYKKLAKEARAEYNELIHAEFKKIFKREYQASDYKISGIVRDEFPYEIKNKLRAFVKKMNNYEDVFRLHNATLPAKDKIKEEFFKNGGAVSKGDNKTIPDGYKGKTAQEVWGAWSEKQRDHFIIDHAENIYNKLTKHLSGEDWGNLAFFRHKSYDELPESVQKLITEHIRMGQYEKGGQVHSEKGLKENNPTEWHRLQIAKKTMNMTPAMAAVMGGMSIEEAKGVLDKYGVKYKKGGSVPVSKWRFTKEFIESRTGARLGVTKDSTPTKEQITKYKDKKFASGESYIHEVVVNKMEQGGAAEGEWTDLSYIKNPSKITVETTTAFGTPDKLILKYDGKKIASFYYNMRGYNQNFFLKNKDDVQYGFGGDKPQAKQISDFKKALKEGYVFIKHYPYKKGGEVEKSPSGKKTDADTGWRFTSEFLKSPAAKLRDLKYTSRPTREDIKKYAGKTLPGSKHHYIYEKK